MVPLYVPQAGDIVMLDFDPQVGHEQGKRRPALVLTGQRYSRASGLAGVCPLTGKRKPYPFALPITLDEVEGAVLVDQLKSLDWWSGHSAKFAAAFVIRFNELKCPHGGNHGSFSADRS
jgi:mRNA interferase MazF